jgi:hypothetical protein
MMPRSPLLAALLFAASAACADQTVDRPRPLAAAVPSDDDPAATPAENPPADPPTPAAAPPSEPSGSTPLSCTTSFGSAITAEHGRLDGTVRAVVVPGDPSCRSDNDHVIVQIDADGATYAAWVNVESNLATDDPEVRFAETRAPLAFGSWAEGWHPASGTGATIDYASTLDMHSGSFAAMTKDTLAARITELAKPGARVSVYFDGFATGDGGHKIHRNGGGKDGALVVVEPSGLPRWLLFHFSQQTF